MQYKRISADCHLDMPWMPPDLFTSMAPRELKDRMPYVVDTDEGPKWTARNGASFGFKNGVGPSGAKFVPGKHHRVDVMAETGLYADGAKDNRRVSGGDIRNDQIELVDTRGHQKRIHLRVQSANRRGDGEGRGGSGGEEVAEVDFGIGGAEARAVEDDQFAHFRGRGRDTGENSGRTAIAAVEVNR